MRRDPDVMGPLFQRQSATALLDWEIVPQDSNDEQQVAQAAELEEIFRYHLRNPVSLFMNLLFAIWYGPSAVQITPEIDNDRVVPGDWMPIHADTIAFSEYGDLAMYVGLRFEGEKRQGPYGSIHILDDEERKLFVLHTHGVEAPDYEIPEEAAYGYAGRGIRDIVWFQWMMKQTALQFWMTWVERYGMGIRVGTYPDGNQAAKDVMEEVLQNLVGDVSVVIPRQPGEAKDAYSIEVQEPNVGRAKVFADLVEGYLAGQIKELIIGQTATTEATSTGLGSSVGDQHAETFRRIIHTDAQNLENTLTRELVWRYHEMNFGDTEWRPRWQFSLEKNDPQAFMTAVQSFVSLGGAVSQTQAREILGITEPEDGEPVLSAQPEQGGEMPPGGMGGDNPLAALLGGGGEGGPKMPGPPAAQSETFKRFSRALRDASNGKMLYAANCGAGAEGSSGFQPGNTCAAGDGGGEDEKKGGVGVRERARETQELVRKLIDDGGFTYDPIEKDFPTSGLVVSTYPGDEEIIEIPDPDDIDEEALKSAVSAYVDRHWDAFVENELAHFGGWWDKDTGRIYLDMSTIVDSHEDAIRLASEHKQEAYFDLSSFETIRVGARDDEP